MNCVIRQSQPGFLGCDSGMECFKVLEIAQMACSMKGWEVAKELQAGATEIEEQYLAQSSFKVDLAAADRTVDVIWSIAREMFRSLGLFSRNSGYDI